MKPASSQSRTVTQIAATADALFALCSDGEILLFTDGSWGALPPIPSKEDAKPVRPRAPNTSS